MVCRGRTGYRTLCSNRALSEYAPEDSGAFRQHRVYRLLYFGCIALAVGILALGILPWPGADGEPVALKVGRRIKQLPLQISEFTYTSQDQNRLVHVLHAEQLVIRPRRFTVFNIKSINEALVENARFELHLYAKAATDNTLSDYEKVLPFNQAKRGNHRHGAVVGMVTRLIANGVRVDIFRDEIPAIVLAAEYGLVEKRKPEAVFINAILKDSRSDRVVRSRTILWDEKRMLFVIPGPYVMSASGNDDRGKSIEIDLDFNIKPAVPTTNS
jgi:hypothetical protein